MSDPFAEFGGHADDDSADDPFAQFGGYAETRAPAKSQKDGAGQTALDFADALSDAVTFGAADKVTDELSAHAAGKAEAPANMLDQFPRAPMAKQSNRDAMEFLTQIEMDPEKRRRRMEWRAAQKAREGLEADRGAANARRAERSPVASGFGTAVGVVAPALLTGGASLGGQAPVMTTEALAARLAARASRSPGVLERGAAAAERGAEAIGALPFGRLSGARAALLAASKAPKGAEAIRAALGRMAARGGSRGSLASVVASGAIGLDRALEDGAFADELSAEMSQ